MNLIAQAILALLCPLIAQASVGSGDLGGAERSGLSLPAQSGIYKFAADAEVVPSAVILNGQLEENQTGDALQFSAGEAVSIEVGQDGILLSALYDDEERGEMPEKIILSADTFASAKLHAVSLGTQLRLEDVTGSGAPTDDAGVGVGFVRGRHHKPPGHCVGYVLSHLGVQVHGDGKDITRALMHIGFHATSCSNPSVGSVASWTGGWHGRGHTAIWNGRCWAYDVGCGDPGHLYHMIGCVHR